MNLPRERSALLLAILAWSFLWCIACTEAPAPSRAMEPTIPQGSEVRINWVTDIEELTQRRTVVVYRRPEGEGKGLVISRVIGVAGDQLELKIEKLYLNGQLIAEPEANWSNRDHDWNRVDPRGYGPSSYPAILIPKDHVFLMSDNRYRTRDSRFFGPVPVSNLKGKVLLDEAQ